jgi:hypothetical protein
MTDDTMLAAVRDCLTAARDSAAGEQMTRPVGDIIARARRRRLRHGLAAVGTAAVIATAAALALPSIGANGASPDRLAAWTVTTEPGGKLTVTIRQLRDPAGLQRRLRADGVPATVRFTGKNPHPCLYYPLAPKQAVRLQGRIFPRTRHASGQTAFTINTTAIPARIGLWVTVSAPRAQAAQRSTYFSAIWTFVYASGHCPDGKSPQNASGGGVVGSSIIGIIGSSAAGSGR